MSVRPYKFQVVAICQRLEGDKVVGEVSVSPKGAPFEVFGLDGLREFADSFEQRLSDVEEE